MRKCHVSIIVALTCLAGIGLRAADTPATNAVAAPKLDIEAIRASVQQLVQVEVQEFIRAFNAHDAKAVASEWSPRGTYTDSAGTVYKGRAEIEKMYQQLFADNPEARATVEVQNVQLVNAFTATEQGMTTVTLKPGDEPVSERYVATHVRQGKGWVMVSVEDVPDATAQKFACVQDLTWLVGTWRGGSGDLRTEMKFARVGDGPFFQRTWTVNVGSNIVREGVQMIGWDPDLQQIASWTFDGKGSTDKGLWSPEQTGWSIDAAGSLVDGTPFSAKYLLTQGGKDTLVIKSMDRRSGDVALPDMPDVTLVRDAR